MNFIPHPLAGGIQTAGSALAAGLGKRFENQRKQQANEIISGAIKKGLYDEETGQYRNPELNDLLGIFQDVASQNVDISQLGPLAQVISPILKQQEIAKTARTQNKTNDSLATWIALKQAGYELPDFIPDVPKDIWSTIAKEGPAPYSEKGEEQQAKLGGYLNTLENLEELKPYVGSSYYGTKTIGGPLRRQTVEKRNEIDTLRVQFEGYFRDKIAKGQFPKTMFEILMERLPQATDSERAYQGKINGLRKMIESDMQGLPLPKTKNELDQFLKNASKSNSPQTTVTEESVMATMPSATKYPGKTIEDEKGNRYRSDGKKWSKI